MHQAIINKKFDRNKIYKDNEGFFDWEKYNNDKNTFLNSKKYKSATFFNLREEFKLIFKKEFTSLFQHKYLIDKQKDSFNELSKTDINLTRNKILHKSGYLPSKSDVDRYNNLIDCLYWIGQYLDIKDSIFILNKI